MAFNYGDIFQNYLQGASFVANSLDRAEARRRQSEEDELNRLAGAGEELIAPKYDKDGKLIPSTSGYIFNDPRGRGGLGWSWLAYYTPSIQAHVQPLHNCPYM